MKLFGLFGDSSVKRARATRRRLFDFLIPVLVTGIQPDQVLGLKELFPRRRRGAACISVTSTEMRKKERFQSSDTFLRPVEIRATRRRLFDFLIPVLVTGIQPGQALGLKERFPRRRRGAALISVTSTEMTKEERLQSSDTFLRPVENRATRRLFDSLIPVLVTGIQPDQVLGLKERFPRRRRGAALISVTSREMTKEERLQSSEMNLSNETGLNAGTRSDGGCAD
ncbi:hypothetical protein [Sinorhizobium meliloti]|uniref:hypothetical protein n=1 Tax=Rhizobium meliloti TaxID=382 RepID=UPI003F186330